MGLPFPGLDIAKHGCLTLHLIIYTATLPSPVQALNVNMRYDKYLEKNKGLE